MDSREKLLSLRERLRSVKPEDEEMAQNLQLVASIAPLLVGALPEDPGELDKMLAGLARGAISHRSDGAEPVYAVHVWNEEEERWEVPG